MDFGNMAKIGRCLSLLLCTVLTWPQHAVPDDSKGIVIGGLFSEAEIVHQVAFSYSIEEANRKREGRRQLNGQWNPAPLKDAFIVGQEACNLLSIQAVALFGPTHEPGFEQTSAICDNKEIPHFSIGWNYEHVSSSFSLDLYPPARAIGQALVAVIRHLGWDRFVFLYQDDRGLNQLQDLLLYSSATVKGPKIIVRRLNSKRDFMPLLKEIKEVLQEVHIVVQANLQTTRIFLDQALAFGMLPEYYHFIFTDLDLYTLDLSPYKEEHASCNISGLRLVDTGNPDTEDLRRGIQETSESEGPVVPLLGIQTVTAVIHDGIQLVATAIDKLGDSLTPASIFCDSDSSWRNGSTLMNFVKTTVIEGTTGKVAFDAHGRRTDYELIALELTSSGFEEFGRWKESHGLKITKTHKKSLLEGIQSLENKTLIVTVYKEEPFVMLKQEEVALSGNDRYEGYCIDVLNEIAAIRRFNFTIREVKDNSYGAKDDTGKWNGLVGELIRGEADLALTSLTISYSRSEVIDFTVPFMHLGISILFKKPEKKDPSLFTFLSPLSLDVWIYMLAAYVGVSLMLWVLARFSPYEWYNPQPCNPDTDVVENQFSLLNSLWFTVGSLMQQGSDIAPRAVSTRLVAGIWWFFTLILIQSYTANLAAFLTVERMVSPIESADDLAKQTRIKYGSLGRGSTMTFFKESKIQTYERMWSFMESTLPSVFVNSSKEGIQRVLQGDYAYLMESSMLEYYVERDCDLMQIGGLLDSKGYGIGLPKGSPYREPISSAILMLQEKTKLTALKEKWWKRKRGGGKCKGDEHGKGQPGELALANVGGVFVLLIGGLMVAFVVAIAEFIYKARHSSGINRTSLCNQIWSELKFALKCHVSKKPARRKYSVANTVYATGDATQNHTQQHRGSKCPAVVPSSTYHYAYNTVPTRSETC